MATKIYATDVNVQGTNIVISVGDVVKTIDFKKINPSYVMREFARGLKLRIDNSSAGVADDEKKLAARIEMLEKIDFEDAAGGISGGRRKESAESFLARTLDGIESLEDYQTAVQNAKDCVRKDEQPDVFVELSTKLSDVL